MGRSEGNLVVINCLFETYSMFSEVFIEFYEMMVNYIRKKIRFLLECIIYIFKSKIALHT